MSEHLDILDIKDPIRLHQFILEKISHELSELVKDCYYPTIAKIHSELLNMVSTNDDIITKYSKEHYKNPKWKLLHDPKTILFILIARYFLKKNDYAAALAALNALTMRYYTNVMIIFVKHCNPDYFKIALRKLSKNHLYNQKDSIGNSLLYLAKVILDKYQNDLKNDNHDRIYLLIYEIRTRIFQSARSFAEQYYDTYEKGESETSSEITPDLQPSVEQKIKITADKISKDLTLYQKIDNKALDEARNITRFNKKLSQVYTTTLNNHKYTDNLTLAVNLLLRSLVLNNIDTSQRINYIEHTKRLMGIKVTKKPVYFKGIVVQIHDDIIRDIHEEKWFNQLSVQSKATCRSFLAYYIALVCADYFSFKI
jgi:hypothetical protein